ncbi:hypothetical protein G6O69_28600 [Pseudenhygromyxa sp. WMMC2535]|uniref:hypothetical protein n=1 Tax=Pseudenhygromyxa sp. WMMC2535 TaxID=2712867 RepID=UPI0015518B1C|nr:hypothetical protein [Pseudenhygromyxa sp. WMMC2535]NVB41827.1 hypothetical protein [Pseudenhygromyxa sp. WMMC2535]
MDRRRLVVTSGSVALMLASATAWASPPPPPPPQRGDSASASTGSSGSSAASTRASSGSTTLRSSSAPPPPSANTDSGGVSDPLTIDQRTPDTDLTGTWTFSRGAVSRSPNYIASVDEDPFFTVNPVGYYQGVSLDGGNTPPFAPTEVGGQSAVLTWTGFERGEASSRVFFQLSTGVEPEVVVEDGRVRVKLPRTSVTVRNNRRKLITRYFNTPVEEVLVSRKGKDLQVDLVLRWAATPTWDTKPGPNGYQLLVFEFPDTLDAPLPPSATTPTTPSGGESASDDGGDAFLPTD